MSDLNVVRAAWGVLRALRVRRPQPRGDGTVDHAGLAPTLRALPDGLGQVDGSALRAYLSSLSAVNPDSLVRAESLAYWINLYNAAAVTLALDAAQAGLGSVMRVPGGFERTVVTVAGEALSLNDVEHGKIRRFKDPRVHGALVCGSLSCPTLRPTPFTGRDLDAALDDQMRSFFAGGGLNVDRAGGQVALSRILLWYGGDFVRPNRMPTFVPASKQRVLRAATAWFDEEDAAWIEVNDPSVTFQGYDWGLGCSVTSGT
jgi:hypothetical protein